MLVVDPTVPLHALLPDNTTRPGLDPFILGSEDSAGYNSGNLVYRCNVELAAYLAHTLAISDNITKKYDEIMGKIANGTEPDGIELPPSDQRALCLAMKQNESYGSRFFHYEKRWLNSYELPNDDMARIQLHTHLVSGSKYRDEYDEYEAAERRGWQWIRGKTAEQMEERVEQVRAIAGVHWGKARIGLPHCVWV